MATLNKISNRSAPRHPGGLISSPSVELRAVFVRIRAVKESWINSAIANSSNSSSIKMTRTITPTMPLLYRTVRILRSFNKMMKHNNTKHLATYSLTTKIKTSTLTIRAPTSKKSSWTLQINLCNTAKSQLLRDMDRAVACMSHTSNRSHRSYSRRRKTYKIHPMKS